MELRKKKGWWFSPFFQLVSVKNVTTVYPVTWNSVLAVIVLLLFDCDVTVDILLLGC